MSDSDTLVENNISFYEKYPKLNILVGYITGLLSMHIFMKYS